MSSVQNKAAKGKSKRKSKASKQKVARALSQLAARARPQNLSAKPIGFGPLANHMRAHLIDPFRTHPIGIGQGSFDSVIPVGSYQQSQYTCNADGSGFIALTPNLLLSSLTSATVRCDNFYCYNTAATAVAPTLTGSAANNRTPIIAAVSEFRVISAALRVTPLMAQTAVPGVILGQLIRPSGVTQTHTTSQCVQFAGMDMEIWNPTNEFYQVSYLPAEMEDLEFKTSAERELAATPSVRGSQLLILLSGFPASTIFSVEFVVHAEGISSQLTQTATASVPSSIGPFGATVIPHLGLEVGANHSAFYSKVGAMHSDVFGGLATSQIIQKALGMARSANGYYKSLRRP